MPADSRKQHTRSPYSSPRNGHNNHQPGLPRPSLHPPLQNYGVEPMLPVSVCRHDENFTVTVSTHSDVSPMPTIVSIPELPRKADSMPRIPVDDRPQTPSVDLTENVIYSSEASSALVKKSCRFDADAGTVVWDLSTYVTDSNSQILITLKPLRQFKYFDLFTLMKTLKHDIPQNITVDVGPGDTLSIRNASYKQLEMTMSGYLTNQALATYTDLPKLQ